MWNEPSAEQLARLPPLYTAKDTPWEEATIYEHLSIGRTDWYVAGYDPQRRILHGYATFDGMLGSVCGGELSLDELRTIELAGHEVDRDPHWVPVRADSIPGIRQ